MRNALLLLSWLSGACHGSQNNPLKVLLEVGNLASAFQASSARRTTANMLLTLSSHGVAEATHVESQPLVDIATPLRPLLGITPDELAASPGLSTGRAKQVWDILRVGSDPFAEDSGIGKKTREALASLSTSLPSYTVSRSSVSSCGTRKLLLEFEHASIETVIIPNADKSTLCVSSQVGCRQGCSFCATGTMGLLRSLSSEQILAQMHAAQAAVVAHDMPPIRNVVFMGMGEPADNLKAVSRAVETMVHMQGWRLSQDRVCVSTVGPSTKHIRALESLPCNLAWSVHAADDKLRKLLVPTTRNSMEELRDAWDETIRARLELQPNGRRQLRTKPLMVEVTLIEGVNDNLVDADRLHDLLAPLPGKTHINLIPYNANAGLGAAGKLFRPSTPERITSFLKRLQARGVLCTLRTTRGDDESSACGQLATGTKRAPRRPLIVES